MDYKYRIFDILNCDSKGLDELVSKWQQSLHLPYNHDKDVDDYIHVHYYRDQCLHLCQDASVHLS